MREKPNPIMNFKRKNWHKLRIMRNSKNKSCDFFLEIGIKLPIDLLNLSIAETELMNKGAEVVTVTADWSR